MRILLLNLNPALVYSKDSDSQSSTTKSGINTQNIIIKDEAEQLKRTGKTVQERDCGDKNRYHYKRVHQVKVVN